VERAVEPPGDLSRDVEHEVGDVYRDGGARHQQWRDQDGEGNAGDGEHHHDQRGRERAGSPVAPLFLEEVDQRRRDHPAASLPARLR
jgi:hypothetical protein